MKRRLQLVVLAMPIALAVPALLHFQAPDRSVAEATSTQNVPPAPTAIPAPKETQKPRCTTPFPDKFLVLGGTLVLTDPKKSVSLIHVHGGPGIAVHVGESIGNHKYEVLAIGRAKVCVGAAKQVDSYLLTVEKASASALHALGSAVGIKQVSAHDYRVPRALLRAELNDLTTILNSAWAVPSFENGHFAGFVLKSVEDSSILRTLGLQAGDELKGANDIPFTNPADGLRAYQELMTAPTIRLHVVRNGRPIVLKYEVQ